MMNINNEDVGVGRSLGPPSYSIQTRLNTSSGAGVNADWRVNLAFAASDPLSELVWSPHNGLSLKCANSGTAYNKPFLLSNVGPSSMGLSLPHIIRPKGSRDGNAVGQQNLTISQTVLDADDLFVDKATLLKPSESFHAPELCPRHGDCDGKGSKKITEDEAGNNDAIRKEKNCVDEIQITSAAEMGKENADLQPQKKLDDEGTSATGQVNKNKMNMHIASPVPPLKMLESAAENDLCHLTAKGASSLGGKELPMGNTLPMEGTSTNIRIRLYKEKGKEKALYDGDFYGRLPDEEDDGHESIQSCNSGGSFLRGLKRQSYDKTVIHGSKKMKRQIHGSPVSTSITRPDSSFMNWISNMVTGLSDSYKEDSSSLALNLARFNDVYGKNQYEDFMCNKTQDPISLDTGFQTMFQSLYCKYMNVLHTGLQKGDDHVEESGGGKVDDKKSLENFPGDGNCASSCKQIVICNREVSPIVVGQLSKPFPLSADIDCSPCPCENDLAENKASEILVCNRAEDGAIPSGSLGEQVNSIEEKTSLDIPMAMSDVPGKSNLLNSFWITRLSTKNYRSEKCKEITRETIECFNSCPKVDLDGQMNIVSPSDQKSSEMKETSADSQVYASIMESQKSITYIDALADLKSRSKLCPILPSPKVGSPEAMASTFARRLDALRHIIPSKERNSSTCSLTCIFCGGCHDLRDCANVTKSELEDLLVKMRSFDRVEESSSLCIRCSQIDHWAISCPLAPSSRHYLSQQEASPVSQFTACYLQLYGGNKRSNYHGRMDDHKLVAGDHSDRSSRKPFSGSFPTYQTWNAHMSSNGRVLTSNLANNVKDNQKSPLCGMVTAQNTVALSEIFHAIRSLRLSRADILRWMDSSVSLSELNGFFLRLRLGKLEAGLESTTYYVARITGDALEHDGCMLKKSILVDVGGIKSSVASQYVSNHDFLEDEIKAWWCRIVSSGCRIPSLDELNSKFNDRKSLGF